MRKKLFAVALIWSLLLALLPAGVLAKGTGSEKQVQKKQYTISPGAGTYATAQKVKISAKKGYRIYYTTGDKFSAKRFVKPGKTKSVKIKKTTTLRVYYVKKAKSLTAKQLNADKVQKKAARYVYTIGEASGEEGGSEEPEGQITEDGSYTSKEDVALYLYTYRKLPKNFMTKEQARALGWNGGGLDPYAEGCCIGGDVFGNYEGRLPQGSYHECDIDTMHKSSRGAKRIVYSDEGKIYYTEDHYETFTQLYDGWK